MSKFKKSMALLLALAMVLTTFGMTVASAASFNDVDGHWAQSLISKWSDKGVVNGYDDGTFLPDANITRAELAKVIATAKGYTNHADVNFVDVNGDEWFMDALRKCVAQTVIGGYDDGSFRPDAYVTREEATTMFQRAYNINASGLLNFVDNDDISTWAKDAITILVGADVISGYEDGTFLPKHPITRAEVVKILDGITTVSEANPQPTSSTGGNGTGGTGNLGGGGGGGGGGNITDPNNLTVTLNANGGKFSNGKTTNTINVKKNGSIGSKATTPLFDGYIFDGWYTSQDAADNLISAKKWNLNNDSVGRNMTLYAGWYTNNYTVVNFQTNGGTPTIERQFVEGGAKATKPETEITRANYTFAGWYSDYAMTNTFDFDNDLIKANTTLYAKWTVDPSYSGQEISIPNKTTGSFQTGTVQAAPSKALAKETVTIAVTPPSGFQIDQSPTITYTSISGAAATISPVKDLGDMNYSFVMPVDVKDGTIEITPKFTVMLATPAPTPTIDPNRPTATPERFPTWAFDRGGFEELSEFSGTVDGLTLASGSGAISGSAKTFTLTNYKYAKVCKTGKLAISFDVTGPCSIIIDAVSASSTMDREYVVTAGSTEIGRTTCSAGATDSYKLLYGGEGDKITITPKDGINMYGIWVEYSSEIVVPTPTAAAPATPMPTLNPNIRYNINLNDQIANGSINVDNGLITSDQISSYTWNAEANIPAGHPQNELNMFGEGKSEHFLNGTDNSGGLVTFYDSIGWFQYTSPVTGELGTFFRSEQNPTVSVPFVNDPGGAVVSVSTVQDGYLTLKLYINANKAFSLYDNLEQTYIESFTGDVEDFYTFVFPCEKGGSYYAWANGSKIGLVEATYSTGILDAKAGETISVYTRPDEGYKATSIITSPESKYKEIETNKFTFTMPASDVTVGASFISSSAAEYTATAVKPENGTVRLEKGVSTAGLNDVELQAQKDIILDASDNFLMSDHQGGKWIVSKDGTVDTTVVKDVSDVGGNATEKMKLSDKAVQYVLENEIESGVFELSYDFYDDNTSEAGRSFRTYLDNVAHPHDETTGQATEFNSDGAFFHMMDVGGKIYVTEDVADISGKAAAGTQVGEVAPEANKWYRVVIIGELGLEETLSVSYYLHGTDGSYNPDSISAEPVITTNQAKFTDGRASKLSQIKFMRTAAGNLYYDNIMLSAQYGTPETGVFKLKAYNGETVNIISTPDEGYQVQSVSVKDTAGTDVAVTDGTSFVMPSSDVDVNVVFGQEAPATPDPTAKPTNKPEPTVDPDGTTTAWDFSSELCSEILVDSGGKTVINAKADYNGLTIYPPAGGNLEVDDSGKIVDGVTFPGRIKFGGAGKVDGDNSSRAMSFIPAEFGTVTVYFAHASGADKPDRSLAIEQNGIIVTKSVPGASNTSFTAYVYPGSPVYIYGIEGLNLYGVHFTTSSEYVEPPATTKPIATPDPTEPPATTDPDATPPPATSDPTQTPDATAKPTADPTAPPALDTTILFESSFDDEAVGTSINSVDAELGGMKITSIDSTSSIEIVDGAEVGADGFKVAKMLKPLTAAKSEQLKFFWTPETQIDITNKVIITAVAKNSSTTVGTEMWALFVNSSNSEVSYKDKNDVEKTTPIISRIGSKGNVLKYTAFEEPIKFSGKWELDSWATFKVEIEPLGEGTYTVTTYKADGIDGYIFTELYSRTITSADGTFTGAISDIGFVSGTQTSDSIPMYVKSYKVEILN